MLKFRDSSYFLIQIKVICTHLDSFLAFLMAPTTFEPRCEKPAFCICEKKDADQLRSNCAADQRLCFRYIDGTVPLLSKSEISSLKASSVAVQLGLCGTWSETPKTGFLTTRLILFDQHNEVILMKIQRKIDKINPLFGLLNFFKSMQKHISLTFYKSRAGTNVTVFQIFTNVSHLSP